MINPLVLKAFLSVILEAQTFLFPYLKSSMTIDESLITSGSVLLSYEGSIYSYSQNNINLPSNVVAKPQFKVSVIYQSLIQDDQSLVVFNDVVSLKEVQNFQKYKSSKQKVVANVLNSSMEQIFVNRLFHADPHPGNIFVIDSCRIAFLDFGIVGVMHPKMREKMSWLFINVIEGDLDGIADAIMDLNMMEGSIDKEVVKQDLFDSLGEYYNTELSKIRLGEVFHKLVDLTRKDNVRLPKDFVLLGKAIITLEGVALTLDKKFNLVKEARPYVKKAIERRTSPQAIIKNIRRQAYNFREFIVNIPERASEFVRNFREADVRLQTIDKDLRTLTVEIDRSSNRVSYGLLITGFLITGALTFSFDQVQIAGISAISFVSFSAAGILGFMLITSILRENR